MKIAITSQGQTLDSEIDPRFGRAQYIVIVDTENDSFDVIDNSAKLATGGAGIQAAQTISEKGVEALITGNVGPNAIRGLKASGVKVYTGASGLVKDSIQSYKEGKLDATTDSTVKSHFGMNRQ